MPLLVAAACQTGSYSPRGRFADAVPEVALAAGAAIAPSSAPRQDVAEPPSEDRIGYVTVGGGFSFQSVDSGADTTTDRRTLSGNVGVGLFPVRWLDVGLSDDVFLTSTETRSSGTTTEARTVANNFGVFANYVLYTRPDLAIYAGPNVGVYSSETDAAGNRLTSSEFSGGFQLGLRHWVSRAAAVKFEWRNIWSKQDFGGATTEPNDVFQSSLVIGVDIAF